jgi:hypothetical protein
MPLNPFDPFADPRASQSPAVCDPAHFRTRHYNRPAASKHILRISSGDGENAPLALNAFRRDRGPQSRSFLPLRQMKGE